MFKLLDISALETLLLKLKDTFVKRAELSGIISDEIASGVDLTGYLRESDLELITPEEIDALFD